MSNYYGNWNSGGVPSYQGTYYSHDAYQSGGGGGGGGGGYTPAAHDEAT